MTTGQKNCHLTKERTDDGIFTVYIVLDPYDFGHASTKMDIYPFKRCICRVRVFNPSFFIQDCRDDYRQGTV